MPRPSWPMYSSTPQLLGADLGEGELQLLAAVAAQRVEDVSSQALRVHADEHVLVAGDLALVEGDVVLAGERVSRKATAVNSP